MHVSSQQEVALFTNGTGGLCSESLFNPVMSCPVAQWSACSILHLLIILLLYSVTHLFVTHFTLTAPAILCDPVSPYQKDFAVSCPVIAQ